MRRHLIGILENKFLLPFPTDNTGYKSKRRQAKIKKILEMPLYCICKKPDTGTLYVNFTVIAAKRNIIPNA